jgi:hypothetical protein
MCFVLVPVPTFRHHILVVVSDGPQEQMRWIAAGWVVAPMKDAQPVWNLPVR